MPDVLNKIIGGCRAERLVGRGAIGAVYGGTQISLDRPVAIKILDLDSALGGTRVEHTAMWGAIDSFTKEAKSGFLGSLG